MPRLIDADDFERKVMENDDICEECAYEVVNLLDDAPTVDAVPVVHGHWNYRDDAGLKYECSACKTLFFFETPYCLICGAMMDKKDGEL